MKTILKTLTALALCGGAATATPLPVDNGLMATVPGIGPSRVETISFCLNATGLDKYQDLMTDSDFETFTDCMRENT